MDSDSDDITIIDHANPESVKVFKRIRKSLRKIERKSYTIEELELSNSLPSVERGGNRNYEHDESLKDIVNDLVENTENTPIKRISPKMRNKQDTNCNFSHQKHKDSAEHSKYCTHRQATVKLNCVTCRRSVCDNCMQVSHFGHEIEDISTASERLSEKVQTHLDVLLTATNTLQDNIETVIAEENHIKRKYIEAESIIKATADSMIMKIEYDRNQLLNEANTMKEHKMQQVSAIKSALNLTVKELTETFTEAYEVYKDGVQNGEDTLVDGIQNDMNLQENGEMIEAKFVALKNPIIMDHNLKLDISKVSEMIHGPVMDNVVANITFEELLPIPIHYPCNIRMHNTSFSGFTEELGLRRYQLKETVTLPQHLRAGRIFIVRGHFWFPCKDGSNIEVYTPQGWLKCTLNVPLMKGAKVILQSAANEVLIGYDSKDSSGLIALHIPLHGPLTVKSTTNVMTDFGIATMAMEDNTLVTLSANDSTISVIEVDRESNIWSTKEAFSLKHKAKILATDGSNKDTFTGFKLLGVTNPMDFVALSEHEFWIIQGVEKTYLKKIVIPN